MPSNLKQINVEKKHKHRLPGVDKVSMVGKLVFNRFRISTARKQRKQIAEAQTYFPELNPKILECFFANFGYAMPLSLLVKIERICREIKPNLVVEFGSGLSTVVISDILSISHGLLISVDESMEWLENTYKLVNHKDEVLFMCIPDSRGNYHAALSKYMLFRCKPDLVVIDGPSSGNRFSEPALIVYNELMSSNSVCVIDDTDREENQSGALRLAAEFSLRKEDYGDPIYVRHQYSILFPEHFESEILFKCGNGKSKSALCMEKNGNLA